MDSEALCGIISSLTDSLQFDVHKTNVLASFRFGGALNAGFTQFQMNSVFSGILVMLVGSTSTFQEIVAGAHDIEV